MFVALTFHNNFSVLGESKNKAYQNSFLQPAQNTACLEQKTCAFCGNPVSGKRKSSLYCSRRCSARAMYSSSTKTKKCLWCKCLFQTITLKDTFCSRTCEAKFNIAKGKASLMQDPWREGLVPPDHYDRDYWRSPDAILGF